MIARCLEGLREHGIGHAVAVDGRYFRGGQNDGYPWPSNDGTREYLRATRAQHPEWLTLVECPATGWPGQEIKRTAYLRAADRVAQPGDWLLQVDGDEELVENGQDYRGQTTEAWLAALPPEKTLVYVGIQNCDAAGNLVSNPDAWGKLYRWQPGLYYGREHWDLLAPDGTNVWGIASRPESPHAAKWTHLRFRHWGEVRTEQRKQEKSQYEGYRARVRSYYGCMNPHPGPEVGLAGVAMEGAYDGN